MVDHETEDRAGDDGESDGLDLEKIRQLGSFALRAVRRRPLLASATFVLVAALGITVSVTMPRSYHVEFGLLAQQNNAIRALSSVNAQGLDAVDNPTKDVAALITRRDNLVSLVRDANLVQRFERTRSPALRLKDWVMALVYGRPTDEEKELAQVYTLAKRLSVTTTPDTVGIAVDWSDAHTAYDLATLIQKNFLEARYDQDVAVVKDSIAVLEDHAKNELADVDSALDAYQKIVNERTAQATPEPAAGARAPVLAAAARPQVAPGATDIDPDVTRALEEKQAQIKALEEGQQRTVESLRRQLVEAQLTLTPMHPTVVALQQQVDAMSQPSPELAQLRSEERALMDRLTTHATSTSPPPRLFPRRTAEATPERTADAAAPGQPVLPLQMLDRDGALQLAQAKLSSSVRAYEDTTARIDAARVELEITRTAYKHRYTVLVPPEVPKKPRKPIAQIIGLGSVLFGGALAMLLAAAADLAGGVIVERWQVTRRLKLDVLGELGKTPTGVIAPPTAGSKADLATAQSSSAAVTVHSSEAAWVWDDVALQKLWLSVERTRWRSLAILGADARTDTLPIAELFAQLAWRYHGAPSSVCDLRELSMRLVDYQVNEIRTQVESGLRLLIALRAISENPTAAPVAQGADGVILCIALGETDLRSAEETVAAVGRERILGTLLLQRRA